MQLYLKDYLCVLHPAGNIGLNALSHLLGQHLLSVKPLVDNLLDSICAAKVSINNLLDR